MIYVSISIDEFKNYYEKDEWWKLFEHHNIYIFMKPIMSKSHLYYVFRDWILQYRLYTNM